MEVGKYKPYFQESTEGKKPSGFLLEKIKGYKKILQQLEEAAEAAPAVQPVAAAPAVAPVVAAPPVEEPETAQSVAEKALQNLAVNIVKDFGLKDPVLRKLLQVADELDKPEDAAAPEGDEVSAEDIDLSVPEDETPLEGDATLDELDLGLEMPADETAGGAEEELDLGVVEEEPVAEPEKDEEEKKKSEDRLKELQDELLDVEDSKPLDLSDFSFKN